MTDIILTIPVRCDDKDCGQSWHQTNYWIGETGYSIDEYGDGDHEPIDESDVPTAKEAETAWLTYYEYVLETKTDPIGHFAVRPTRGVVEFWRIFCNEDRLGVAVTRVRRDGCASMDVSYGEVPDELRSYMLCDKEGRISREEIDSLDSLHELAVSDDYITAIDYIRGLGLSFRLMLGVQKQNPDYESQLVGAAQGSIDRAKEDLESMK